MRERAAAKLTRENSQEKKLRLWARREGSVFEVPGRKPTAENLKWNCEWYPRNNLTQVLLCSSKYILFLRTCKFNTTEGHLASKYIFPAFLGVIDCFASKYTIILFLLIVRITANTIYKHGVDQLEQNVDTPDIYYCNSCGHTTEFCPRKTWLGDRFTKGGQHLPVWPILPKVNYLRES